MVYAFPSGSPSLATPGLRSLFAPSLPFVLAAASSFLVLTSKTTEGVTRRGGRLGVPTRCRINLLYSMSSSNLLTPRWSSSLRALTPPWTRVNLRLRTLVLAALERDPRFPLRVPLPRSNPDGPSVAVRSLASLCFSCCGLVPRSSHLKQRKG